MAEKKTGATMDPRKAAVLSLNACLRGGRFANLELDSTIRKYRFEGLDKSFFTALLYGTTERLITLDYVIGKFSSVPLSEIEPVLLCILRTAVYQILYMDRVPDSAACNEAVTIGRTTSHSDNVCGYLNGVLRAVCRHKDEIPAMIESEGGMRALSLKSGIPEWILASLANDYGEKTAKDFARYINDIPQTLTLRVNTMKTTREALLSSLGAHASPTPLSRVGVRMDGSFPAQELYGFEEGLFFVQDEASQLCAGLLNAKGDDTTVVDVCACPGGKSFSAAIALEGKGKVYAFDLHKNRLSLIESGAARLGLANIETQARDARTCDEALLSCADYVICDVPCSGLGVIAKKPDIRHKREEDVASLPAVQYDILCAAVNYLKPGGTLVYSTCTLRRAENEAVVEKFLSAHAGYHLESTGVWGEPDDGKVTLFPQTHHTDGFFLAKIVKAQTSK